jgi:hypothetical protein
MSDRWPLPRAGGGGKAGSRPSVEGLARLPGVAGVPDALLAACGDGALRVLGTLPTGVVACVDAAHGGKAGAKATRPLEGVAIGNASSSGGGAAPLAATIAMACRELRAWDGAALGAAAAAAGKKRKGGCGGGEEEAGDGCDEGSDGDDAPPLPARKAAKAGANFFADLL